MKRVIRNIIWDVDGTLFDTYPAISRAFRFALNDLGKEADLAQIETLARVSLGHCVSALAAVSNLSSEVLEQAFSSQYSLIRPQEQPPFPGVLEICQRITAHGGKNVIVTHRGKRGTKALLAAHGMTHFFSGCVTQDDGFPKKPDPAAFKAIIRRCSLPVVETMTVGDRGIDMLAGHAAGLFTCLFGAPSEQVNPDLCITAFPELLDFLPGFTK